MKYHEPIYAVVQLVHISKIYDIHTLFKYCVSNVVCV